MDPLFEVHILNEEGKKKARELAETFDYFLANVRRMMGLPASGSTRELSIVKTKLEEACFFAKKGMANDPVNQQ